MRYTNALFTKFTNFLYPIISLGSAIVIWQLLADLFIKNKFILPSFSDVVHAFFILARTVLAIDIAISLLHFGIGLSLGIVIGVPIGAFMGWFKRVEMLLDPIIEILRPIPPLAWVPIAIIWFHLTHFSAGFVVFIGTVFPILINTYSGFANVNKNFIDTAKVLGCLKNWDLLKSVALPSSLPMIITGIRVSMGVGWMCVIAAEIFGVSNSGLGYRLFQKFYFLHQMDNLFVYMLILGIVALLLNQAFRLLIEKRLWLKSALLNH